MLKLAFDAKRAYQNYSGLGNYSRYLLETMIQMFPENDYYLYTPQVKIHFIDYLVEFKKQVNVIDITSLPKFVQPAWRNIYVPFDLKRKGIQLYHGLSNELPRGIHSSIPQIVTIHDLIFLKHPEWYNASDIRSSERRIRYACKAAAKIIATSEHTKRDIISFYSIPEAKIEVVYQDCDARFHKRISEAETSSVLHKYKIHKPYILSVGTIEERKNQLLILKAFRLLKEQDLQLILVGRSTSYIKEIYKYIHKHQLTDQVRVLTDVTNDDLPLLYGGALMSVYASVAEGFGIPVLESMYTGCPVITTNGTAMQELASDAALYTSSSDVEEMVMQMRTVMNKPEIRSGMIARGKIRSSLFDSKQSVKKTMDIYKSLITG